MANQSTKFASFCKQLSQMKEELVQQLSCDCIHFCGRQQELELTVHKYHQKLVVYLKEVLGVEEDLEKDKEESKNDEQNSDIFQQACHDLLDCFKSDSNEQLSSSDLEALQPILDYQPNKETVERSVLHVLQPMQPFEHHHQSAQITSTKSLELNSVDNVVDLNCQLANANEVAPNSISLSIDDSDDFVFPPFDDELAPNMDQPLDQISQPIVSGSTGSIANAKCDQIKPKRPRFILPNLPGRVAQSEPKPIGDSSLKDPFHCNYPKCTKTFARRDHLQAHQDATHKGIKPYRCKWPSCEANSARETDIMRHIRKVHLNVSKQSEQTLLKVQKYYEVVPDLAPLRKKRKSTD